MADLTGKTAVITGAASGIGAASVEAFVAAGAQVVAADIQDERGAAMVGHYGEDRLRYVHCDVTDATQLAAALQTCVDAFGGLDILFNNAGAGGTPCTLEDFDPDGFDRTVALLLKSVMTGTHLAVPHFKARGGGSVINTSSITALNPGYGPMVYSVCKAGVAHFTKLAAAELSKYNIRVNAILPGFIATGIFGTAMGQSPDDADRLAAVLSQGMARNQPLGRGGVGTDVAEMAAFLASDAASFITGAGMTVDGGLTLGPRHAWDPSAPDPISAALAASPELAAQMHQLFSPADSKA